MTAPSRDTRTGLRTPDYRVTGIGGVFLRARNASRLQEWYKRHLGLNLKDFGGLTFFSDEAPAGRVSGSTTWAVFPHAAKYIGRQTQQAMVNYRVEGLDALLARLRKAHVRVDPHQETARNGRFAWAYDLERNRFELWEPREPSTRRHNTPP
jgi:catechol 2,3-dioxygenase-like lactoylglutathione lyase family enzyme